MTTTPRRKACVECRQQKIRCDVEQHKTPHDPCSRCKKMNLECRILPTSTRNLRQTKAEMRRELEELRWNMRQGDGPNHSLNTPGPSQTGGSDAHLLSPMDQDSATYSTASGERTVGSMSPSFQGPTSGSQTRQSSHGLSGTHSRILDGYVVDAKRIDDCFALFFSQYHELLPILDPMLSPNEYYELSPFLFWSITVTGARRYNEDPTILDRTSQLITPLAFSSMALRSTPIPVIQGLLILCTWRLPTNSHYKDLTHVLCGAAVHLASQIGLHVAGVGQDFARMPLKKDQDKKVFRAKLWIHCVIVSIRCSCSEGIPPLIIAESFFDGDAKDREDLLKHMPTELQFLHKAHLILSRAMSSIVKSDIISPTCDATALRSLISIFDAQLVNLAPSSPSELDLFQLNCLRINILAFHFFTHPTNPGPDMEALTRLYSLSLSTLQTANSLAQTTNLIAVCPSIIERTLALIGFIILKLVRSPLAQHLDLAAGEQSYSIAVQLAKSMSIQTNDLGARVSAIMANLWRSQRIFRRKDGSVESLGLRLRTRLSMSVSFDMFWYWREEFGNMSNPYNAEESVPSNAVTHSTTPRALPQPQTHQQRQLQIIQPLGTEPGMSVPTVPLPAQMPGQMVNKFEPREAPMAIQSIPAPVGMSFDGWDGGSEYSVPPMIDQFPDYDWAASFDYGNDWLSPGMAQLPPDNSGYAPMNFG